MVCAGGEGAGKETHEAQYAQRGDRNQAIVRTESTVLELVSFQPGAP